MHPTFLGSKGHTGLGPTFWDRGDVSGVQETVSPREVEREVRNWWLVVRLVQQVSSRELLRTSVTGTKKTENTRDEGRRERDRQSAPTHSGFRRRHSTFAFTRRLHVLGIRPERPPGESKRDLWAIFQSENSNAMGTTIHIVDSCRPSSTMSCFHGYAWQDATGLWSYWRVRARSC